MIDQNMGNPMASPIKAPKIHYVLWTVQIILALLFLFSGGSKFFMPIELLQQGSPIKFSALFYHFIGTCEVLGAIGLTLPSLLKIKTFLTPLAAVGLVIIMIVATTVTLMSPTMAKTAILPFIVGLLCIFVAYGRFRLYPIK